jgi:hypothetical protein
LLTVGWASSTHAVIITTGNLFEAGVDGSASTVDHWGFSVLAGGIVSIDLLSWEVDSAGTGLVADVNGDGEIAFFDPYIYLFADDGSLDPADLIDSNDDSGATFTDGSIYDFDSFISLALAPGDYILAVGAFFLSIDDAIDGINDGTDFYPTSCDGGIGAVGAACTFVENDHGDYQITWTGDLAITSNPGTGTVATPEPATLALLGLGLAAVGARRRFAA